MKVLETKESSQTDPEKIKQQLLEEFKKMTPGDGFSRTSLKLLDEFAKSSPTEYINFYISMLSNHLGPDSYTRLSSNRESIVSKDAEWIATHIGDIYSYSEEDIRSLFIATNSGKGFENSFAKLTGFSGGGQTSLLQMKLFYLISLEIQKKNKGKMHPFITNQLLNPYILQEHLLLSSGFEKIIPPAEEINGDSIDNIKISETLEKIKDMTRQNKNKPDNNTSENTTRLQGISDTIRQQQSELKERIETSILNGAEVATSEELLTEEKKREEEKAKVESQMAIDQLREEEKKEKQKTLKEKYGWTNKKALQPFTKESLENMKPPSMNEKLDKNKNTIIAYHRLTSEFRNLGTTYLLIGNQQSGGSWEPHSNQISNLGNQPVVGKVRGRIDNGALLPTLGVGYENGGIYTYPDISDIQLFHDDGSKLTDAEKEAYTFTVEWNSKKDTYRILTNFRGEAEYSVRFRPALKLSPSHASSAIDNFSHLSKTSQIHLEHATKMLDAGQEEELVDYIGHYLIEKRFEYTLSSKRFSPDPVVRDTDPSFMYGDCDVLSEQWKYYLELLGIHASIRLCFTDNNEDGVCMRGEAHGILDIVLPSGKQVMRDATLGVPSAPFHDPESTRVAMEIDNPISSFEDEETYEYVILPKIAQEISDFLYSTMEDIQELSPLEAQGRLQKILDSIESVEPISFPGAILYFHIFNHYRLLNAHATFSPNVYQVLKDEIDLSNAESVHALKKDIGIFQNQFEASRTEFAELAGNYVDITKSIFSQPGINWFYEAGDKEKDYRKFLQLSGRYIPKYWQTKGTSYQLENGYVARITPQGNTHKIQIEGGTPLIVECDKLKTIYFTSKGVFVTYQKANEFHWTYILPDKQIESKGLFEVPPVIEHVYDSNENESIIIAGDDIQVFVYTIDGVLETEYQNRGLTTNPTTGNIILGEYGNIGSNSRSANVFFIREKDTSSADREILLYLKEDKYQKAFIAPFPPTTHTVHKTRIIGTTKNNGILLESIIKGNGAVYLSYHTLESGGTITSHYGESVEHPRLGELRGKEITVIYHEVEDGVMSNAGFIKPFQTILNVLEPDQRWDKNTGLPYTNITQGTIGGPIINVGSHHRVNYMLNSLDPLFWETHRNAPHSSIEWRIMETLLQYTREDKPTQLWQDTFQKLLQIDSEITRIERVYQDEIHEIQQQRIINAVRNYLAEKVAQQNPDRLYKHQQVERSSGVLDSRKQGTITGSIVPLEPGSTERKEEIIRHHFSPNQAYRFYEPSNNNTPILIKEPGLSQQLTDVIVDELGFEYIHEELTGVSTEQLTKEARNYVLNKTIKTPGMMQLEKRKEELVQQYTTQHQNYTKDIIELRSQYALLSPEKKQQFLFYLMNFQNQFMREYLMPEVRKRKLLEKDYPILNLTTEEIELLKAGTHIEITDDGREVLRIPDTFNKKEERDKILRRVFQANSKMNAIDLYNALEKLIIGINNDEVKTTSTTEERIHSLLGEYRQVLRELPIEQQTEIIDAAISHYFQDALMPRETDFNKLLFMVEQNDLGKYFLKDH